MCVSVITRCGRCKSNRSVCLCNYGSQCSKSAGNVSMAVVVFTHFVRGFPLKKNITKIQLASSCICAPSSPHYKEPERPSPGSGYTL